MPLSDYNPKNICFCHQDSDTPIERSKPICTSRDPIGFNRVKLDYYGLEGGYQYW